MKKTLSLLLLAIGIGFATSCSDDADKKGQFESKQFQGEWCMLSGTTAIDLVLGSRSLTGRVYTDIYTVPKVSDNLSGPWFYYADNDVLRMEIKHSSTLQQQTNDYKVLECSNYALQLREQETGSEDTYYRVVDSLTVEVGHTLDINLPNFPATGYVSSNPYIASVNAQGHLVGQGQGIAFVSVYSEEATVIVRIKVTDNVDRFIGEVTATIDNVLAEHGAPDASGQIGQNKAIIYRQSSFSPSLSAIQYQYDEGTREITRILTVYTTPSAYEKDAAFVRNSYLDLGDNMYAPIATWENNTYAISPFVSDGYYISYANVKYHLRTGHFVKSCNMWE